jgi:hypothetical protein
LVDGFERLRHELADSRLDHLLGGLPVRPPSDASVDRVICGDGGHPEFARVLRRSSPRKGHEIPTFP